MIKRTSNTLILLLGLLAALGGCASVPHSQTSTANAPQANAVSYEVKPGDSLGNIALRVTGNIDHWRTIADSNNITDPRTLTAGTLIVIPQFLLADTYPIKPEEAAPQEQKNTVLLAKPQSTMPVTTGNGVSVARQRSTTTATDPAIRIMPVSVNRTFELTPLDAPSTRGSAASSVGTQAPQIKVLGTYYPKGIYEQPANYARLVHRVSPGAMFELESVVNDWYKIVTSQGIGYLRINDGALVE